MLLWGQFKRKTCFFSYIMVLCLMFIFGYKLNFLIPNIKIYLPWAVLETLSRLFKWRTQLITKTFFFLFCPALVFSVDHLWSSFFCHLWNHVNWCGWLIEKQMVWPLFCRVQVIPCSLAVWLSSKTPTSTSTHRSSFLCMM